MPPKSAEIEPNHVVVGEARAPLSDRDFEAVLGLHFEAFPEGVTTQLGRSFVRKYCEAMISGKGSTLWLARRGGQVCGFMGCSIVRHSFERVHRSGSARLTALWRFVTFRLSPVAVLRAMRKRRLSRDFPDRAELLSIVVSKEERRTGIGKMFMDVWMAKLRERHIGSYIVFTDSPEGISLYEKHEGECLFKFRLRGLWSACYRFRDASAPAHEPSRDFRFSQSMQPVSVGAARGETNGRIAPNVISVDVEDWLQSTVSNELALTNRFEYSTRKVMETFDRQGVKATFFILGLAAEKAPGLVKEIQAAGHEIQSHGYGHRLVYTLTPEVFRRDLDRSKKLLEDMIGTEITGYRAPSFCITLESLWALDVLVESGFKYDSSVFPLKTRRYGVAGAPWYPHKLKTPSGHELIELPVASFWWMGRRVPIGGGGYIRLFPYRVLRRGLRQINAEGYPATIYMHPYEFDDRELAELDYPVGWSMRFHQGMGRRGFPGKIERMLGDFSFGPMREAIAHLGELPTHEHRCIDRR